MAETTDVLVFRKFQIDQVGPRTDRYLEAAIDKLQTLYPSQSVTRYDSLTLGIGTDSLYSPTGIDIYELGMVDDEIPAIRNQRDGAVLTFRD